MGACASSDNANNDKMKAAAAKTDGATVLSADNFVPNPTFDLHIDGEQSPLGWQNQTLQGEVKAKWEDGKGIPHSGDHCLKIESGSGGDGVWFCDIRCDPNTEYRFSGEIKSKNLNGGGGAYFDVATVKGVRSESVTGTQADWKRFSFTFNSGDLEIVRLRAVFGGGSATTGEAWFDTIDLVKVNASPDKVPNLVPNPAIIRGVDNKPYAWFSRQVAGSAAEFIWATGPGVARVGSHCLSIKADSGTHAYWFSDIRVTPNKNYKFSAWIKSADVAGGEGAYFTVANVANVKSGVIQGSGDYAQVTASFNSGKLECVRLVAWLGANTSGQAWYDDVELIEG